MKIKKDHLNFAIGPVQLPSEVRALGADPIPYFRTSEFSSLMKENEFLMKQLVKSDERARVIFLTASGTAAMEAAIINVFDKNDKLLIINGGSFGHRFCEICDVYGIPYDSIKLDFGRTLYQEHLSKYDGKMYTGLLVNMHETSSGVLYDMKMVGDFCKQNDLILVVDAISSFIADELDMQKIGADIVITGSQKALASPPGISILVISEGMTSRINERPSVCYYLDLKSALKNGERGQTPFTPAVGTLIQLNARLNQISDVGIERIRDEIKTLALDFRTRIKGYPFRIPSETISTALTPLSPKNRNISAHSIFERLKEQYNIIVCPNGGEFAHTVFRVGHLGALSVADNDRLFRAFDALMATKQL